MADLTHKYAQTTGPTGNAVSYFRVPVGAAGNDVGVITATLDIGTANLTLNDVWNFVRVPADFVITDVSIDLTDMDSNGTPTLDIDLKVNDGTTTTTLNSADIAAGQTGGSGGADQNLPLGNHAAAATIYAEVVTAAATAVAGKATIRVEGYRSPTYAS